MRTVVPLWYRTSLSSNLWRDIDELFNETPAARSADFSESADHYLLSIDLPGLKKDDLQIEVTDHKLTVAGERKRAVANEVNGVRRYQQTFTLPKTVNTDKVEARYEDGVLELYLPKTPATTAKKITIQSGSGGFFDRLLGSNKNVADKEAPPR